MIKILRLRHCKQNNLHNLNLEFPKEGIIGVVGVSGAGKSSLAHATIHAEGQHRYLDALSLQSRAWIKQLPRPDVTSVEGLTPTLAVTEHLSVMGQNTTVATQTEIYDLLTLLFAHIGVQYSPATNEPLSCMTIQQVVDAILNDFASKSRLQILASVPSSLDKLEETLQSLQKKGYVRFLLNDQEWENGLPLPKELPTEQVDVVVDRLVLKEGIQSRLYDSLRTAFRLGKGLLCIREGKEGSSRHYTEIYLCPKSGKRFPPLQPIEFKFSSPRGACPTCRGKGGMHTIDPSLLSEELDYDELIDYLPRTVRQTQRECFAAKTESVGALSEPEQRALFLEGSDAPFQLKTTIGHESVTASVVWRGWLPQMQQLLEQSELSARLAAAPFLSWVCCPRCNGGRLKEESLFCRINDKNIFELTNLTVSEVLEELPSWAPPKHLLAHAEEIIKKIEERLTFLEKVGLGYLVLNQQGNTLSKGEAQRVHLASQIASKLSGLIYILDEPSTGLHPKDVQHLRLVIEELHQNGNTIFLVDHHPELFSLMHHIIELGPGAGVRGGQAIFQGTLEELKQSASPTGEALRTKLDKRKPRSWKESLGIGPVSCHNLKNCSVDIPLGVLVGVCGVSGSGKSSLILDVLAAELKQHFTKGTTPPHLTRYESLEKLLVIDQKELTPSPRSTPATYMGLMTQLRQLMAQTRLAQARGYNASYFSLSKRGGRCEVCEGRGEQKISMPFFPDSYVVCDTCKGKKYNEDALEVTWNGYNMAQILSMPVDDIIDVFAPLSQFNKPLQALVDMGISHLSLGQPFSTLSGGERHRLKLAAELSKKSHATTLYLLDEPTSGLHPQDCTHVYSALEQLIEQGHSVVVIEHNQELLAQCDWLIEMGPGGGPHGGQVVRSEKG